MKSKLVLTVANIAAVTLTAFLTAALLSCGKLDVVGNGSVTAFNQLLQQIPAEDDAVNAGWSIAAPDHSARFIWSRGYAESPVYDVMIEFDAAPFIAAGLSPEKLPENYVFSNGVIKTGIKFDGAKPKSTGETGPLAAYEHIVKLHRQLIGYHGALDHYGVNLGGGNLFEWAKDMTTNDKDMVFVLAPAPFAAAGADISQIEGWLFAPVTVDDENGKPVQVDKLLKPFDLPPPPPASGF
ncbi:MAG: hypothetical protein LBK66_07640 [Spirochaetaceae bacterium]|jgi:hypothetical protein|nr:hypothetical protein [Spirochaetaceae bacterium]